ncbi:hypothetical protein [Rhodopseudomonas sp. P2A-2r]|uniref:hypothetical protein n=1 Tax=unclassified Rhodopseudomonas TaxID=2638247 RepID=UPI00223495AF|nr:hypothetical protein [Rhodopseudomonas sp. P2A-2r]UZE48296.1 hypothetical protein ONR75_26315 [Rhodopseudomonas sp. P2A-2r]
MKIVKTSAIALTLSAMLAGPVLAQGAASGTHTGGTVQQGGAMQRGGAAGGADTELNAATPGGKAGAGAATKGTVGSGNGGMARGTAGATGSAAPNAAPNGLGAGDPAAGTKR